MAQVRSHSTAREGALAACASALGTESQGGLFPWAQRLVAGKTQESREPSEPVSGNTVVAGRSPEVFSPVSAEHRRHPSVPALVRPAPDVPRDSP